MAIAVNDWIQVKQGCGSAYYGEGDIGQVVGIGGSTGKLLVDFVASSTVKNTSASSAGIRAWWVPPNDAELHATGNSNAPTTFDGEPLQKAETEGSAISGTLKKVKKEWKPDTLRTDIDVMEVTAQLVSVEVGK